MQLRLQLRYGDAITSLFLGLIERAIGAREEIGWRFAVRIFGDAEAGGQQDVAAAQGEIVAGDRVPQFFRDRRGLLQRAILQQHEEFFATPAGDDVVFTHGIFRDGGDFLQDAVAGQMTVIVIDCLEVVDVEQNRA